MGAWVGAWLIDCAGWVEWREVGGRWGAGWWTYSFEFSNCARSAMMGAG